MAHVKRWYVEVFVDEDTDVTRAEARLHTGERTTLRGVGIAHRNPRDPSVPEIGDEVAAARALADLGHTLIETAARDIAGVTHERVSLQA